MLLDHVVFGFLHQANRIAQEIQQSTQHEEVEGPQATGDQRDEEERFASRGVRPRSCHGLAGKCRFNVEGFCLPNNHEVKRGLDAFTKVKSSVPDEAVGWLDHVLA